MNKGGKFIKKLWCSGGGRVFPSTFVLYNLPFQEESWSPLNPGASRHLKYTNYFHEENNTSYLFFLKLVIKTGVSKTFPGLQIFLGVFFFSRGGGGER